MKKIGLGIKIGLLLLITVVLQLPISLIKGIVAERQDNQTQVTQQLSKNVGGEQLILAPILVQPYQNTAKGAVLKEYILPTELQFTSDLPTTTLKRGIYTLEKFTSANAVQGSFDTSAIAQLSKNGKILGTPYLSMAVKEASGLEAKTVKINGTNLSLDAGSLLESMSSGRHAKLGGLDLINQTSVSFAFEFKLNGSTKIGYLPLGEHSTLQLKSNWASPKFTGEQLPVSRDINAQGFSANWESNQPNATIKQAIINAESEKNSESIQAMSNAAFSTELLQTVDQYQLTERTVKYSILLIGMTFLTFFLFEVLRDLRVHPIQYALVGVALSIFYLLLLALSEKVGFNWAYAIASTACVGQITFYVSHVLHSVKRGAGFGALLSAIYLAIFGLLQAEEMALLIGSISLFIVMSAVMIATRRLNWYALTDVNDNP
jgi:inner membrane protein